MDFNDFLWLIILAFVCYRLAQLIANDQGPLNIFGHLRAWIDARAKAEQERGKLLIWQSVSEGINCPFCVGIWVAIGLGLIYSGAEWYTVVYILAIAGLQSFLEGIKR